jgi:hypothetical protein
MVYLLGRSGLVEEAKDIINNMPIKTTAEVCGGQGVYYQTTNCTEKLS